MRQPMSVEEKELVEAVRNYEASIQCDLRDNQSFGPSGEYGPVLKAIRAYDPPPKVKTYNLPPWFEFQTFHGGGKLWNEGTDEEMIHLNGHRIFKVHYEAIREARATVAP